METKAQVYAAICAVTADLGKVGISKERKNQQQGYNFRGIDDVYGALSPLLAKHNLCILPRVLNREQVERTSAKGGALFYTTLTVEFDIVHALDGSSHTVRTIGEAMDSADKSSNKAQSAAYKYMAMEVFCIPTEGDNDADSTTHEVAATASKELIAASENAARHGTQAFRDYYKKLPKADRDLLTAHLDGLKGLAQTADVAGFNAEMDKGEQVPA